jgi:ribulose-phosphate 3-epimerase
VFDAHLMIVEPERYVDAFRSAGCDRITFHLEATCHAQRLLVHLHSIGAKAGIAICPQTPVAMLQDVLDDCDTVLVMSVNPGFSGQQFISRTFDKVRELREMIDTRGTGCLIEIDGGVGERNARELVEAGADVLVMGSTIFDAADPGAELRRIRKMVSL